MPNKLGLHARPAARFVETAARFDAAITVADETTGRGPADARSLSALITLGVRQGHDIRVQAAGADATAALAALRELADDNFGDENGDAPAAAAPAPAHTHLSASRRRRFAGRSRLIGHRHRPRPPPRGVRPPYLRGVRPPYCAAGPRGVRPPYGVGAARGGS